MGEKRVSGVLRYGVAVTLVGSLMVPSTAAIAQPADQAKADVVAQWTDAASADQAAEGATQDAASTDAASDAGAQDAADAAQFSADQLLAQKGAQQADDNGDAASLLPSTDDDPAKKVTIIVQLGEGNQGVTPLSNLLGRQSQDRHAYYKDKIREAAGDLTNNDGVQLFSADDAQNSVQELRDYYHVIDGFAVKAPAGTLDAIKSMDGVKNAFLSQEHAVPADEGEQDAPKNQSSLDMTGADQVSETGKGQTVAIIDSGVATAHEAFSGDLDDSSVAYTADQIKQAQGQMSGGGKSGVYASEKIPFAFDYADFDSEVTPKDSSLEHGTHVAGIAAANGGQIRGTAPDAQIFAMKVASDVTGSIPDDAILAALDDAAVLNPDAINMSLGTDGGFSSEASSTFADALGTLRDQGTTLNVAAGNAYSAAYANQSGSNLPYASDPDSGIVSAPSALVDSVSVASVNNSMPKSAFTGPDGTVMGYDLMGIQENGQNNGKTSPDLSTIDDGSYEYVDLGFGSPLETNNWADEHDGNLSGKIALIQRGPDPATGAQLTFTQKVQNVLNNAGWGGWPAAIIVCNNEPGDLTNAAVSDMVLNYPVVCISQENGEILKNATDKHVTLKAGTTAPASKNYTMSDFSSWGVTPDLQLKPEITAPGGNIYSSVLDDNGDGTYNDYTYMSGTSMATPQMTGISAQMHEYVENDAKFKGMSDDEKKNVVTQLLMSTANPIPDYTVDGSYITPRKQGAGLTNVPAATKSDVFATVDGATDVSRPKADLGENADGTWSFTVTLHNLGSADHSFTPDASALSEQVANNLFQQHSDNWAGKGIDVTFDKDTVTVPAGGTAAVTVNIAAGQAFKDFASANTPNGTFVDGFASFKAADEGGYDLSVPYLAFYGDWSKASAFDAQLLDGAATADNADGYHIYGSANADPNGLPLGLNLLDANAAALAKAGDYSHVDPNKMVVSNMGYDSAPNQLIPLTGLLRGVQNLTYTYKNSDGDAVRTYSHDFASKSYYYATGGYIIPTDARIGYYSSFDGKNEKGVRLPDGKYTLERTAQTAGPGSETQTDDVASFWYDTVGPQISDITYEGTGDDATVSFSITDDSWLAAYDFHDPATGGWFYRINPTDADTPTENADGSRTWHFTTKVADIKAAWDKSEQQIGGSDPCPNTVPLYAWDYGLNPSTPQTVVVTPVAAESITLDKTEVALAPGQEGQLTATVKPENSTEKTLAWSSSDENVVKVDQNGKLTGVGNGTATITAASAINPDVKATATVTVADVSEDQGIIMSTDTARVEPNGTVELTAIVAPSLQGKTIEWASANPDIATVKVNPDDPTKATVTGGSDIGDATIMATVEGKSAQTTVQVRPANYSDFIIDESTHTLIAYAGNSSFVDIPNNVTRINDQAFMSTPVQEVNIPASVQTIGYQAFYHTPKLETVNFEDTKDRPSQLKEIEEEAFSNTVKFKEIHLPGSVEKLGKGVFSSSTVQIADLGNVREIPQDAFSQDAQLYSLTMSDKVTSIGDGAFSTDLSLADINLSDVAEGASTKGLPSHLRTIGASAFSGTLLGGTLVMPKGVESIGGGAFALTPLTGVELNEGLKHLEGAFTQTNIMELTVPSTVTEVGSGLFAQMARLQTVNILTPDIADKALIGAFVSDVSLQKVTVPDDCKYYTVEGNALFNKDKSTLVTYMLGIGGNYDVPEGVTDIADYAFYQGKLTSATFPSTLKNTGDSAFCESQLGGSVVLPEGMENIGRSSFMNLPITSADIGGAVTIGGSAFYSCPNLTDVELGGGVAEDTSDDRNRLTTVGNLAFGLSSSVKAIIMPDSLTKIGDGAFSNIAGLQEVHIGAGLTGDISGFVTGSNNLNKLTVSEKNPVYSADHNVLYGVQNYEEGAVDSYGDPLISGMHLVLSLPTNEFTEYTVKPGTVQIDNQAFRNNEKLEKVVLPEGLKRISTGAFNNCTVLKDVNFPSSLQHIDGFYSTAIEVADIPAGVVSFGDEPFMGNQPQHMIVRGMSSDGTGEVPDSMDFDDEGTQTGYYGPGVKKVRYGYCPMPKTVVLPSTLTTLSPDITQDTPEATAAYANEVYLYVPVGADTAKQKAEDAMRAMMEKYKTNTMGWMGQLPADFDIDGWVKDHIKDYTPLGVNLSTENPIVAGQTTDVKATVVGGVDGAKQIRFVQPKADGTEEVLSDWTDAAADADGVQSVTLKDWTPAADTLTPRAEVRDATMLTANGSLGFDELPEVNFNLGGGQVTVQQGETGPTFSVEATAVDGVTASYQWYRDDAAIDGATAADYTVPTDEVGSHAYRVVVTFTNATGASTAVSSGTATVDVQAPPVQVDTTKLADAITAAEALNQADYTEGSWKVFAAALESARQALANPTSQTAVDAAASALTSAQDALVKVSDLPAKPNTGALESAISAAEALNEADYTPESWAVFQAALKAAKAVQAEPASQGVVDAATDALQAAQAGLVKNGGETPDKADTAVLSQAITIAEGLDASKYTEESWANLQTALEAAKAQLAQPGEQADVDAATVALVQAVASLEAADHTVQVDTTKLADAVSAAEQLKEADYTPESWKVFAAALDTARAVLANPTSQEAVDAAASGLASAQDALVKAGEQPAKPDTSALEGAIAAAEQLKEADYTAESWKVFQAALDVAKAVAANPASDEVVSAATDALKTAQDALVKAGTDTPDKADTTVLEHLVKLVGAFNESLYTPESWANLQTALKAAQDELANPGDQGDVDAAWLSLLQAVGGLEPATTNGDNGGNGGNNGGTAVQPGGQSGNADNGGSTTGGSATTSGTSGKAGTTAKTGDAAPVAAVAATGLLGGLAAAVAAFFARRRNRE